MDLSCYYNRMGISPRLSSSYRACYNGFCLFYWENDRY